MSLNAIDKKRLAEVYQNLYNTVKDRDIHVYVSENGRFKCKFNNIYSEQTMTVSDLVAGLVVLSDRLINETKNSLTA